METPRKIQLTGRNTYIVSLPREWIQKLNLSKGNSVYLTDRSDGTLTLSAKQMKREPKEYKISVNEGRHTVMRNVVSAYVGGAGKITLTGKEVSIIAEQVRHILSGVEIIDENGDEIILKIMDFENVDMDSLIKRQFNVTRSMFSLVADICRGKGNELEISKKEVEVDRLYLLVLRNLVMSNMPQKESLFKAIVAKSMEKVGDHLVDLCKSAEDAGTNEWLADLITKAGDVYAQAFDAFAKNELDSGGFKAAIVRYKEIYDKSDSALRKIKDQAKVIIFLVLLEKCNKVIRYSEDIMESNTDVIFARMGSEEKG